MTILLWACQPTPFTNGVDLVHLTDDGAGGVTVQARSISAPDPPTTLTAAGTQATAPGFLRGQPIVSVDGVLQQLDPGSGSATVLSTPGLLAVAPMGVGDDVVFTGFAEEATEGELRFLVVRLQADGTVDVLVDDATTISADAVSDDGVVFFMSRETGTPQIRSIGLDAGEPTQVTTTATIFGRPAVSADGTLLCWEDAAAGVLVLADVVHGVAGEPRRLGDGIDGSDPAFAADGRVVFRRFLDVDDAVAELFVYDPADNSVSQLTNDGGIASAPALAR